MKRLGKPSDWSTGCTWALCRCKPPLGEGHGTPLQYSCLENPMAEEPGRLQSMGSLPVGHDCDFTFTFPFHALEKAMATHSSVLAWRIPGMGKPGGQPSMGSQRVGHDWSDLAAAAAASLPYAAHGVSVLPICFCTEFFFWIILICFLIMSFILLLLSLHFL